MSPFNFGNLLEIISCSRNNFEFIIWRGNCLTVFFYIFDRGQYKRLWKRALKLFLIFFELDRPILFSSLIQQQIIINMRRAHPIFGPLFSWKSFLNYLFIPPSQICPRNWMLNSRSTIYNCLLTDTGNRRKHFNTRERL